MRKEMRNTFACLALAALALTSCGDSIEIPKVDGPDVPEVPGGGEEEAAFGGDVVFSATLEVFPGSESESWDSGAIISIYDGESVIAATNSEEEGGPIGRFPAHIKEKAGAIFAIAPAVENPELTASGVKLEIPAAQTTAAPAPIYRVAKSQGPLLYFRNLVTVVNISADFEGIDRVEISAGGVPLAGVLDVDYSGEDPAVTATATTVTLTGTIEVGESYQVVLAPATVEEYTIVAYSGEDAVSHFSGNSLKLLRGQTLTLPALTEAPDVSWLPGTWNVYGGNSSPFGLWVLGGSGSDPAFVSPIDKSWCWNDSIWKESDNELTITLTSFSGNIVGGTLNWTAGANGGFWDYIWKSTGEDLSRFYDKIPKGESAFTADVSAMTLTLSNGEKPRILMPGTHTFVYNKTREIPSGCFGLAFHNMDPIPATSDHYNDKDRFINAPIEYVMIFEKP